MNKNLSPPGQGSDKTSRIHFLVNKSKFRHFQQKFRKANFCSKSNFEQISFHQRSKKPFIISRENFLNRHTRGPKADADFPRWNRSKFRCHPVAEPHRMRRVGAHGPRAVSRFSNLISKYTYYIL